MESMWNLRNDAIWKGSTCYVRVDAALLDIYTTRSEWRESGIEEIAHVRADIVGEKNVSQGSRRQRCCQVVDGLEML